MKYIDFVVQIEMRVSIHNHAYDLSDFARTHPGGRDILETASQMEDATPLFESYHSLADLGTIKKIAGMYRLDDNVVKTSPEYTYDPSGFYDVVRNRVRDNYFNNAPFDTKATWWWAAKVSLLLMFSVMVLYGLFTGNTTWVEQFWRGCVIGMCHVSVGFNVMHDASHCAISKRANINEILSRITNATLLWNHHIWARHHVYAHHSFTGEITHDPDTKNSRPFLRKSREDPIVKYVPGCVRNQTRLVIPVLCGIPGQFFGQTLVYAMSLCKGRVWGVPIDTEMVFQKIDSITYLVTLGFHAYVLWNFPVFTIGYYACANTLYYMCIAPDHDTYENSVRDHTPEDGSRDWGELQVRRSANFGVPSRVVSELFGGINYQIEHHLFPGVNHVHYPYISPIVKLTCKEYDIPYNTFTWEDAMRSCFQTYEHGSRIESDSNTPTDQA